MLKLDNNFLIELGLGSLPEEEKKALLAHIFETLEMRVGMKLAERMTNEQLLEFEQFLDRGDDPGALRWLETNFPDYKQVVADELEKLKAEIKTSAPQILAASQQPHATDAPQPQQQPPQQPQQYDPGATPQQQPPQQPPAA